MWGPDFHRPLSAYLNAVMAAGCRITEVAEPGLDVSLVDEGPGGAEALFQVRNLLVVSALRDDG